MKPFNQTFLLLTVAAASWLQACKPNNAATAVSGDAAAKTYVVPGKYDEFYNFVSGGFSGQLSVYGLPSGEHRIFNHIRVQCGRVY